MKDLVIMVADKNMEFALKGALSRSIALGISDISYEFRVHMHRDGGVRTTGPDALALESRRFSHALLLLDFEGSGTHHDDPEDLEQELDDRLRNDWNNNAKSIVLYPEVDIWVWGADALLQEIYDWPLQITIRQWLRDAGFEFDQNDKPKRPKEALEAIRKIHKQPRSSALYMNITERISLSRCRDTAFICLKNQLQAWFNPNA